MIVSEVNFDAIANAANTEASDNGYTILCKRNRA